MTDNIIALTKTRRRKHKQAKRKATTMCAGGFHKWQVWQEKQFDPKHGKLVTVYRCQKCDVEKVTSH
ncbi:MAG: hypothetical protein V2I33_08215 [Kangiellaceae bacterium]|nr:hypothetical protein [Kangiellaceae bacterium]